jgi:hypothetical protein
MVATSAYQHVQYSESADTDWESDSDYIFGSIAVSSSATAVISNCTAGSYGAEGNTGCSLCPAGTYMHLNHAGLGLGLSWLM